MKTLTIRINMENAAFEEGIEGAEVARILHKYAAYIAEQDADNMDRILNDLNGNSVGTAVVRD